MNRFALVSLAALVVASHAFAADTATFVCKVKSSSMRMYSKSARYQLQANNHSLVMENGSKQMTARPVSEGVYKIDSQNLFAHDEWDGGMAYLSNSMLGAVQSGNSADGEMTVMDHFTDGNERTVFDCKAGLE